MNLRNKITKLPISARQKIICYNVLRRILWFFKYGLIKFRYLQSHSTFVPSNSYYGHEYWLKEYSGYRGNILAMIEHGVYFGDDTSKVGFETEWEIGNIITYGESRWKLLKSLYPQYNIIAIGPRIHYAPIDDDLLTELSNSIDKSKKTMAVFPAHSLADQVTYYDTKEFLINVYDIIEKYEIGNVIVSLHPSDYKHNLDFPFKNCNFILTGGGNDPYRFLPRVKAIISVSDVTFSNSLSTHIGYSIYLNKPHIFITQQLTLEVSDNFVEKKYMEETELFAKVFAPQEKLTITDEQKELCDYYWGISKIMSPQQLHDELKSCEQCAFLSK